MLFIFLLLVGIMGINKSSVAMVNQLSLKDDSIKILDNLLFNMEKKMINQEKNGETIFHDDLWDELLN